MTPSKVCGDSERFAPGKCSPCVQCGLCNRKATQDEVVQAVRRIVGKGGPYHTRDMMPALPGSSTGSGSASSSSPELQKALREREAARQKANESREKYIKRVLSGSNEGGK